MSDNTNYFLIGVLGDLALQMYIEKNYSNVELGITETTSIINTDQVETQQVEIGITETISESGFTGLQPYFKRHGREESLIIAGGLMFSAKELYDMLPIPKNDLTLSIYSAGLDYTFRKQRIFKSLDKYYENTSVQESMLYAVIPMLMGKYIKLL